jgi:hypothetical protein
LISSRRTREGRWGAGLWARDGGAAACGRPAKGDRGAGYGASHQRRGRKGLETMNGSGIREKEYMTA